MFKLDWGTYLTTTENVIYAVIDGRGSGFRGDDLLHEIYYNLGGPEVQDQLDVTRQLLKRYSFFDKTKVAIWGWSYGGEFSFKIKTLPGHMHGLSLT
jgi:dipeptidyl-peptidase-4